MELTRDTGCSLEQTDDSVVQCLGASPWLEGSQALHRAALAQRLAACQLMPPCRACESLQGSCVAGLGLQLSASWGRIRALPSAGEGRCCQRHRTERANSEAEKLSALIGEMRLP
jgi:hypothetical protein